MNTDAQNTTQFNVIRNETEEASITPVIVADAYEALNGSKVSRIELRGSIPITTDGDATHVVFDFAGQSKRSFIGSAAIAEAKTWAFSNNSNALKIEEFVFNMSGVFAQHLTLFRQAAISGDWNDSTKIWTPPGAGDYIMNASFNGTLWLFNMDGPF